MFYIIKTVVWLTGLITVIYFALPYFGYELNLDYFDSSKIKCQENINQCAKEVIQQGTQNAKCEVTCIDPNLIIKKK